MKEAIAFCLFMAVTAGILALVLRDEQSFRRACRAAGGEVAELYGEGSVCLKTPLVILEVER